MGLVIKLKPGFQAATICEMTRLRMKQIRAAYECRLNPFAWAENVKLQRKIRDRQKSNAEALS